MPVDGQAAKPQTRGTKICGVARCDVNGRFKRSSPRRIADGRGAGWLSWSLVGWLSGSVFERLELWKSKPVCQIFSFTSIGNVVPCRNGTLTRQNTLKTCAAKTLDGLDEKRFTTIASTWIRRLIDRSCYRERVGSSGKHGPNRSCPSLDLGFSDIHKTSVEKVRTL